MRLPSVKKVLERLNPPLLHRPVESVTAMPREGEYAGPSEGHILSALKGKGLAIEKIHGHAVTYQDRTEFEQPDAQWSSIRVSHPNLSGKKLKELVSTAVSEGRNSFYRSSPSNHLEVFILSTARDWRRFANGRFPLPHERNKVLVVTHKYGFVG